MPECCNQRGGARCLRWGGGAGLRQFKGGALLDPCNQTDVAQGGNQKSSSLGGGAGGARGAAGLLQAKRGGARCRLQGGGAGPLQSQVGCAILSARAGAGLQSKGEVRDRVGGWTLAIKRGVARYRLRRGGAGLLQLNGGFAISSARRVAAVVQFKGGALLDPCNQTGGCARGALAIKRGRDIIGYRLRGRGGCWTLAFKVLDCCKQRGAVRYRLHGCCNQRGGGARYRLRGGAGPLQSKGGCAISSARGCWTAAIKGRGVRYRLRRKNADQRGGARYRLRAGVDCCNQRGGCATSSARRGAAPWTAIKGGVRDIVCPGGCWTPAIKRGVCDIVCAGGVLDPCNERGVSSAQGGWTAITGEVRNIVWAIKGGMRDIVCVGGCWTAAIQGGGARDRLQSKRGACAISFARWDAGPLQLKHVRAISLARGALDHCNQRRCARYRLHGGCSTAAGCNRRRCARYRLRPPLHSKGVCAMSLARGGCWTIAIKGDVRDIVCGGGGAGRLQSNGVCAISFAQGVLDHCNQRGCARYRLHGRFARRGGRAISFVREYSCGGGGWYQGRCTRLCGHGSWVRDIVCTGCIVRGALDKGVGCGAILCAPGVVDQRGRAISFEGVPGARGGCAISCGHGAWVRDIVCVRGVLDHCHFKKGVGDIVCAGGWWTMLSKGACATSSVLQSNGALYIVCTGAKHWVWTGSCSCWPLLLRQAVLSPGWFSGSQLDLVFLHEGRGRRNHNTKIDRAPTEHTTNSRPYEKTTIAVFAVPVSVGRFHPLYCWTFE